MDWITLDREPKEEDLPPIGKEVLCCVERKDTDIKYAWLWARQWIDEEKRIWHWSDNEFLIEEDEEIKAYAYFELPDIK